jgi:hypothetical protein
MSDNPSLAPLLIGLVALIAIGALFVVIAFHAAGRFGRTGLVSAWIVGSALLAFGIAARLHTRQTELGFSPNPNQETRTGIAFALISLVALGAAALTVWRRHARGEKLTRRALVLGVAAFLGGGIAFLAVWLVADVFRFVRG